MAACFFDQEKMEDEGFRDNNTCTGIVKDERTRNAKNVGIVVFARFKELCCGECLRASALALY